MSKNKISAQAKTHVPPLQQEHWWALHDNKDGSIRKWFKSEIKAQPGTTLRCYQANNEKEALAQATAWAKAWRQRHAERSNEAGRRWRKRMVEAGLCTQCGVEPAKEGRVRCSVCAEKKNAQIKESKARAAAGLPTRERIDPLEFYRRERERSKRGNSELERKWGGRLGYRRFLDLKKVRQLATIQAVEDWLCGIIREAGGGAALDEYENERAQKEYAKRTKTTNRREPIAAE